MIIKWFMRRRNAVIESKELNKIRKENRAEAAKMRDQLLDRVRLLDIQTDRATQLCERMLIELGQKTTDD